MLKTTLDAGVPVSLHSDAPVALPVPLEEVWIAVNRFSLSGTTRAPDCYSMTRITLAVTTPVAAAKRASGTNSQIMINPWR